MKSKIEYMINAYKNKLKIKQNIFEIGFKDANALTEIMNENKNILLSEISLIKKFISDLEGLLKVDGD